MDVSLRRSYSSPVIPSRADKRLTVLLRDGNYYIGKLSTFDQFSNVVLVNTGTRCAMMFTPTGAAARYATCGVATYFLQPTLGSPRDIRRPAPALNENSKDTLIAATKDQLIMRAL